MQRHQHTQAQVQYPNTTGLRANAHEVWNTQAQKRKHTHTQSQPDRALAHPTHHITRHLAIINTQLPLRTSAGPNSLPCTSSPSPIHLRESGVPCCWIYGLCPHGERGQRVYATMKP